MKQKIFIILLIAVGVSSCKSDKTDQDVTPVAEAKEANNFFQVSFDLVVAKDDNFHLYYTEDGTINFNEEQSVWMPVKGSESVQEVVFSLPVDVVPTHLRVDLGFGKNEQQSDIQIKKFKMNYFDKSFVTEGGSIFDYFYPNELNTVIDVPTATVKRKEKSQPGAPSLNPHIKLSEEIGKLVK